MTDVLLLTKADENNYRAICNFVNGRAVRKSTQRTTNRDCLSPARKLSLLVSQDYCCAHCYQPFEFRGKDRMWRDITGEHVIAFRFGGEANHHNIILVHGKCNRERDQNYTIELIEQHYGPIDRDMLEYVPVLRFKNI